VATSPCPQRASVSFVQVYNEHGLVRTGLIWFDAKGERIPLEKQRLQKGDIICIDSMVRQPYPCLVSNPRADRCPPPCSWSRACTRSTTASRTRSAA
jgi:hypothetical protein